MSCPPQAYTYLVWISHMLVYLFYLKFKYIWEFSIVSHKSFTNTINMNNICNILVLPISILFFHIHVYIYAYIIILFFCIFFVYFCYAVLKTILIFGLLCKVAWRLMKATNTRIHTIWVCILLNFTFFFFTLAFV